MQRIQCILAATACVASAAAFSVRVCTNTACKKGGSLDTLEGLRELASTSEEANHAATLQEGVSLAATQAAFAASRVETTGCLGGCGSGPNCCMTAASKEQIYYDVYKPKSLTALLEAAGLTVPDAATKAWLRRMYAIRALRSNKPAEARTARWAEGTPRSTRR